MRLAVPFLTRPQVATRFITSFAAAQRPRIAARAHRPQVASPLHRRAAEPIAPFSPIRARAMSSVVVHDFNPADLDAAALDAAIGRQADHIRHLKTQGATKEQIGPEVDKLNLLKEEKVKREAEKGEPEAEQVPEVAKFDRGALESVLLKRFFYAPAFGIYGG